MSRGYFVVQHWQLEVQLVLILDQTVVREGTMATSILLKQTVLAYVLVTAKSLCGNHWKLWSWRNVEDFCCPSYGPFTQGGVIKHNAINLHTLLSSCFEFLSADQLSGLMLIRVPR